MYETDGYEIHRESLPSDVVHRAREAAYYLVTKADAYPSGYGRFVHLPNVHRTVPIVASIIKLLPNIGAGPLAVTHAKFAYKYPKVEHRWRAHQDLAYKPEGSERRGKAFIVPLEAVDESNGTLEVFPGSHVDGRRPHHVVDGQWELDETPLGGVRPLVMQPGDVAVMHLGTVHRSGINTREGSLRAILFVELEPFMEGLIDDTGGEPVVI